MANLLYRASSTAAVPGATTVKGLALTNSEIDGNFRSIDLSKIEQTDAVSTATANLVVRRDASGNFSAGTITATLSGNASTATHLQTSRTINGVSFNGTANINVPTQNTLTRGTYLTGNNFNGSAATTWAVDATSVNTASKVVARDASGDFSANIITVVDLNSTSDRNLKDNIIPINDPMAILNQLEGVGFTWKHNGDQSYGIIAQELEKVLPELVNEVDGHKMVSYIPLIAFLIQAIKAQQVQIDELRNR